MKRVVLGLCALLGFGASLAATAETAAEKAAAELRQRCLAAHILAIEHDMARIQQVFGWMLNTEMGEPFRQVMASMKEERERLSARGVAMYALPQSQVLVGLVKQVGGGMVAEFAEPTAKARLGYVAGIRAGPGSLKPEKKFRMVVYWLWSSRTDEAVAEAHLEENPARGYYVYIENAEQLGANE